MSTRPADAPTFRALHAPGRLLVLPNAWDAGSAALIQACGAAAIATSSAALAWSHGYADGHQLPVAILTTAVAEIARVVTVPLSVDCEAGYASDPRAAGETIAAVVGEGAVGVNLEDGNDPPDVLCAKIEAAKRAAARAGVDLFVNARTDAYLRKLVPAERAAAESIARGERYRAAGADGLFVPAVVAPAEIRAIADAVALPLNVLAWPALASVAELAALGVRRLSAGGGIAKAALGALRRATAELLEAGRYDAIFASSAGVPDMNRLFARKPD